MKFITMIPTTRNDGSVVSDTEMQDICYQFHAEFGGSQVEGLVSGYWVDGGKVYEDQCLRVTVSCDNSQLEQAKQLVLTIGRRLGQLAMYFEVIYYDGVQILKVQD